MPRAKSARYAGQISRIPLKLRNAPREEFRAELERIPFLGYEVEQLCDGRVVCITKPGGKNVFGQMKVHDFMVWIYNAAKNDRWRISHKEIYEDIESKLKTDQEEARRVVAALQRVHDGEEPDDVMADMPGLGKGLPGESPELLLKVYKWIWGQEDCNYPKEQGRSMSMKALCELAD